MIRKTLLTGLLIAAIGSATAQNFNEVQTIRELAKKTENFFEGYSEKTIPNSFTYHSFRHDLGASMISRCLEAPMPMGWKTGIVPVNFAEPNAGFLWIAAMDMNNSGQSFDVWFNGVKRFRIPVERNASWSIPGENGGILEFQSLMLDRHRDSHGYMSMQVPSEWIMPGVKQEIKIQGDGSGSSTWIIIYEAADALAFLKESAGFSGQYRLNASKQNNKYHLDIISAPALAGQKISIKTSSFEKKAELTFEGDQAKTEMDIPVSKLGTTITLYDDRGEVLSWDLSSKAENNSIIMAEGVLKNSLVEKTETDFSIVAERSYMPDLVEGILALSNSDMGGAQILLMNSSHQDIAWMDSPEKCMVERDTMLLQPLFNRASKDKDYRFDIEDALMVKEYIERHPGKKELVKNLFDEGRISCGATYIQPYEEMYSGEALARQFYFGAKWLKDEFGYTADTYWNVDVPGRTLQMPQLMKKAGVENLVATRQELGFYDWYSPDGSKITSFSNGHYGDSFGPLGDEYYIAADYLADYTLKWQPLYTEESKKPVVPVLSDWDMSPAKDYSELISSWSSLKELKNKEGEIVPVSLPDFREALAPDMFSAFRAANPVVPEIHGERPALWMYIHGPSHQKAQKVSREGDILLTQVEKLATINSLLEGSFRDYPEKSLREAWEAKIYPDHGWGGNMGWITDAFFQSKYEFALNRAKEMSRSQLSELGSRIDYDEAKGRPVLVFNSLNWKRSSPVEYTINFILGEARDMELKDASGNKVPVQISRMTKYQDGSLKSADIKFIASEVPSIGYKVFYLNSLSERDPVPMPKQGKRIENQYYVLEFGNGGLNSIFDKELDKEIISSDGFTAGEVFTMRSVGNGAGEFDQVQQPDMEGFDKTGNYSVAWKLVEDGPVYTAYKYRQPIRNAVVEQKIILYKDIKKIDFETAVLNWEGILYREYRMALPVNAKKGKVVYEVPYGRLEVGKDEMEGAAGERYQVDCKDIHPRSIQNWVNVSSDEIGVTMSSSVVGIDYVDITGKSPGNTLIQAILFASRRSCHGLGNEYLQTGDHYFHFSLQSHKPGWENGYRFGVEANEKLLVTGDMKKFAGADLPEEKSFFSLESDNLILSVIKKAENSPDVIIRGYEVEGREASTGINSPFVFESLVPTNLIEEENGRPINMNSKPSLKFGAFSIETFKLVR